MPSSSTGTASNQASISTPRAPSSSSWGSSDGSAPTLRVGQRRQAQPPTTCCSATRSCCRSRRKQTGGSRPPASAALRDRRRSQALHAPTTGSSHPSPAGSNLDHARLCLGVHTWTACAGAGADPCRGEPRTEFAPLALLRVFAGLSSRHEVAAGTLAGLYAERIGTQPRSSLRRTTQFVVGATAGCRAAAKGLAALGWRPVGRTPRRFRAVGPQVVGVAGGHLVTSLPALPDRVLCEVRGPAGARLQLGLCWPRGRAAPPVAVFRHGRGQTHRSSRGCSGGGPAAGRASRDCGHVSDAPRGRLKRWWIARGLLLPRTIPTTRRIQ